MDEPVVSVPQSLEEVEKAHVINILNSVNGNKSRAAHILGISIKTLYNKLHLWGEFEKFALHAPKVQTETVSGDK